MVGTEIPKHYTGSPSSVVGTPHLTINRDATYELDESTHFEGELVMLEFGWLRTNTHQGPRNS